jgi:hypothetical protein
MNTSTDRQELYIGLFANLEESLGIELLAEIIDEDSWAKMAASFTQLAPEDTWVKATDFMCRDEVIGVEVELGEADAEKADWFKQNAPDVWAKMVAWAKLWANGYPIISPARLSPPRPSLNLVRGERSQGD